MGSLPAKPFSSGTDYACFKYTYCKNCTHYKERENDGFPELPEFGGCKTLDACERARFDISLFPSDKIRILTDRKTGEIITFYFCKDFEMEKNYEN